jgi:hypothetical protein
MVIHEREKDRLRELHSLGMVIDEKERERSLERAPLPGDGH